MLNKSIAKHRNTKSTSLNTNGVCKGWSYYQWKKLKPLWYVQEHQITAWNKIDNNHTYDVYVNTSLPHKAITRTPNHNECEGGCESAPYGQRKKQSVAEMLNFNKFNGRNFKKQTNKQNKQKTHLAQIKLND